MAAAERERASRRALLNAIALEKGLSETDIWYEGQGGFDALMINDTLNDFHSETSDSLNDFHAATYDAQNRFALLSLLLNKCLN